MIPRDVAAQFRAADPKTFTKVFGPADAVELAARAAEHQAELGERVTR